MGDMGDPKHGMWDWKDTWTQRSQRLGNVGVLWDTKDGT